MNLLLCGQIPCIPHSSIALILLSSVINTLLPAENNQQNQVTGSVFPSFQIGDSTGHMTAEMNLADLRNILGISPDSSVADQSSV